MGTELLKVRSMPTPFWCAFALGLCFLGGIAAAIAWGTGDENTVLDVAVSLPTWVASVVFGVWVAGVEFGQDTMRRALAADPRRLWLVASKLATVVLVVTVVTVLLTLFGAFLFDLAGSGHDSSIDMDLALRNGAASVLGNLVVAAVGLSLTLLTRSMAGGLTITLVFFFVLDTALSFIPKVGDYTLGSVTSDVEAAIQGSGETAFGDSTNLDPALAVLALVVWLVVLIGAAAIRTQRSDIK
jgi:ABC-type transport system involved in multi-copper enzyme maturation permease subunit